MELRKLPYELTVCKLESTSDIGLDGDFLFVGKTDEEISLVCETREVPDATVAREDGWRGFVVCGTLDFSLIGILSGISTALAENGIGIFAVSTYNTDYILVKAEDFGKAAAALANAGYAVTE